MRVVSSAFGAVVGTLAAILIPTPQARAADPYMQDRPEDTGAEPAPSSMPTTSSQDIWIRRVPDPNYNPEPFNAASPPWTPQPHQNAQYADPALAAPNWVYVRVRNRGAGATLAGARLKLYWTKVGGAQNWPANWVDYFAQVNGQRTLNGMEITKPRRNAATVTPAERDAYVQAILAADTSGFAFPDGVTFWDKQNQIHSAGPIQSAAHGNPAFLPWHREFVNRYEVLLQKTDPTLKLLYWDWSQDPRQPINGFSYFTPSFMGAIGAGGTTTQILEPFVPLMSPVQVLRNGRAADRAFAKRPDANVLARTQYNSVTGNAGFRSFIETGAYHNTAHVDIGGSQPATCPAQTATCLIAMSYVVQAARDPFFFLLHGNVDRLWAQWQRASLPRQDARPGAAPYGLDSSNANIVRTMPPWDGSAGIEPWTAGSPASRNKTSLDPSIVSPPIYDTAPLTIPVLQDGQEVVMQIPWYPPNPAPFGNTSFVLLARIETAPNPPYGMTTPEIAAVATNVRNNNKISRRNVTVLNAAAGAGARVAAGAAAATTATTATLANDFAAPQAVTLQAEAGSGAVELTLPATLLARWKAKGAPGQGVRDLGGGKVEIAPGGKLEGIELAPGETFDLPARARGKVVARLAQLGLPGDPGGVAARTEIEPEGPAAPALGQGRGLILPQFLRPGQTLVLPANSVGDPARFATATLFVDGRAVETRKRPPFDFSWLGQAPGQHELRIEATDKAGAVASITRVVTVVQNLPPQAQLLAPADGAQFPLGAPIKVQASASDPDGKVARVDFFAMTMAFFADPVPVGSDSSAPYGVTISNLGAGMWMLYAVAVDREGVEAQSIPIHVMVMPKEGMAHPKP